MQHLVDTDDLSIAQIDTILSDAEFFQQRRPAMLLRGKLLITLFFEPSTRTRSAFEVAAKRLGADVVHLDPSRSSTKKGESLYDTFANLCAMEPDGVIIRHSRNETPKELASFNMAPVINAGAGNEAHPSQALLDLFTIRQRLGDFKGKKVAIVGDIVNSRVASSAIRLFVRMGMDVVLVAPKPFMPKETTLPCYEELDEVIKGVDVVISLRAQLERHAKPVFDDYGTYAKHYCITPERIADHEILIMHPGPVMRNIDISDEVLDDPRCSVLDQVRNGVYIRMAILKLLLLDN